MNSCAEAPGVVGAGSVISRDTPANALSVVRGKLTQKEGWKRPSKKRDA